MNERMRWLKTAIGRRTVLAGLAGTATLLLPRSAHAQDKQWVTALSLVDRPKYTPDFKHFSWVNPDAPKGGDVTLGILGGFDTLNPYPVGANVAPGISLLYDQLMEDSPDEGSTNYAQLAEAVWHASDFSTAVYRLRKDARFHDGQPVTVNDVIWTLDAIRKVNPQYDFYYKDVSKAEQTGDHEVTFTFARAGNRELPFIIGQLQVMPKHFWTGKDAKGQQRDLAKPTTEPPLGNGPYRVASVDTGRGIVYERVADWWGKDLPVNRGQHNLDRIRYVSYLDPGVMLEAFKAGEIDFRAESSAKNWATQYEFAAVKSGAVKKVELTFQDPKSMQGFGFNLRRPQFSDPRTRQAFNFAFDFEWANKNLFFGQYRRTGSYFENQELAATGLPAGRELELLNEVRDKVPPEVFTAEFKNPFNESPDAFRRNLRTATQLLKDAGWVLQDKVLVDAKGGPLKVEFLLDDDLFERIIAPYVQNLQRLGIQGSIRIVDAAQYVRRVEDGDFDMIVVNLAQSQSPGNEQRDFWSTAAADKNGSRNRIGIKNPAVDALVEKIVYAKDRAELVAACRALDRVLLWNHYVVPHWHSPGERLAYWDKYKHPATLPSQGSHSPQSGGTMPTRPRRLMPSRRSNAGRIWEDDVTQGSFAHYSDHSDATAATSLDPLGKWALGAAIGTSIHGSALSHDALPAGLDRPRFRPCSTARRWAGCRLQTRHFGVRRPEIPA